MTREICTKFLRGSFFLCFLAACSPVAAQPREPTITSPSPTAILTITETGEVEPMQTAPSSGEIMIEFQRSGGFAGISETWLIYADGRLVGPEGGDQRLTPDQITSLMQDIVALGFFDFNDSYLPKDPCCDRFSYEITVHYQGLAKTVQTMDGQSDLPSALIEMLHILNRFTSNAES